MATYQYVTLVVQGGTPVRLADQTGAPFPTTGSGALVFANGATLNNVTIIGQVIPSPLGLTAGSVTNPSVYFATSDRGFYSQGNADVSVAANGALMASFEPSQTLLNFNPQATTLKLFSDFSGEASIQGYNLALTVPRQLTLQKYGANVAIGTAHAPVAGGDASNAAILFTSSSVLLGVGTGAPTISAAFGSIYLVNDSSYVPYVNNNNTTGWEQIITANATQTLTNKTLTAPVIAGAVSLTGQLTVTQGVITANAPVTFTQTWNNGAINFTSVLINSTKTAEAGSSRILSVQLAGSDRFYVDQFGTGIFNAGGFFGGNMNIETGAAIPAGGTQDVGINMSTTAHFGIYFGSGAAASSQHQGSIYLRSDGYPMVNTNGTTGWDTLAGLASTNAFTGTNTFTTQSANDNSTKAATTAYADRVLANLVINVQVFTSSGTYTPHANLIYCVIECWGGGGAGGSTVASGSTNGTQGAGGGAGSYSRKTVTAATIGGSQVVTIGAGGTPGAAGNNPGGAGGDTSVGALCIGKGGGGGPAMGTATAANVTGGAGGVAGTGDVTSVGAPGSSGTATSAGVGVVCLGAGGSSSVGAGGNPASSGGAGAAGTGHGSGGSGGTSLGATAATAGGAGTAGYIVITEFCTH